MTAFGLLLPTREIVMNQDVPNFRQILDLAEHAEALGFDSVWVGDSVLHRLSESHRAGFDPAIRTNTSRLQIFSKGLDANHGVEQLQPLRRAQEDLWFSRSG